MNEDIYSGDIDVVWPISPTITLQGPEPDFIMNAPDTIDNNVIRSQETSEGLPFLIKEYESQSNGDTINIFLNGLISKSYELKNTDKFPIKVYIPPDSFNYTGIADIYFEIVEKSKNSSTSQHLLLKVDRPGKFPDPYQPPQNGLVAPVPIPQKYLRAQFLSMQNMSVTGSYINMQIGDIVQLNFELRGNTLDHMNEYYHINTSVIEIDNTHIKREKFEFIFDYKTFSNIDGNIGTIYYSLYRAKGQPKPYNDPKRQYQSQRSPVIIDVVPPFLDTQSSVEKLTINEIED